MRALIALLLSLWLAPAWAGGTMLLLGAGPGTPGSPYVGPGDVASGAAAFYSCARAYNASYANGTNSLCDLVAVTGGAAVCTLRVKSDGFVDLAASYCSGTTPSAACAAASGGSCKVSKMYDQTGNSRDISQGTLSASPALTFSALGGLPCVTFTRASSQDLRSSATYSRSQPYSYAGVSVRTGSTTSTQIIQGDSTSNHPAYGYNSSTNTAFAYAGTTTVTRTASDSSYHALSAVINGTSSVISVDGTGTTGASGTTAHANNITVGSQSAGSNYIDGAVCETGIWPSDLTASLGSLSTNQHGTNGYNF